MKHLNLLVLRSPDIERARQFYELLGMRFSRHAHGTGPEHYAHEDERGVFEIYPTKQPSGDAAGLGFAVDDLAATRESLIAYAPAEIRESEWARSFVIRDPDGRRVEVKQA